MNLVQSLKARRTDRANAKAYELIGLVQTALTDAVVCHGRQLTEVTVNDQFIYDDVIDIVTKYFETETLKVSFNKDTKKMIVSLP